MRFINNTSQLPTIFIGDFNEVSRSNEHVSMRCVRPGRQMNNFQRAIDDCGLQDIGFVGFPFTWCNNFISPFSTRARLDRGLANKEWQAMFPEAEVLHLSSNNSDHLPLFVNMRTRIEGLVKQKPRFQFEESWCMFEETSEIVRDAWNSNRKVDPAQRGKANLIKALQRDDGEWIRDQKGIKRLATNFYQELFSSQTESNSLHLGDLVSHRFSPE
ncbi:hypothetical protein LIER_23003 [Lithospermum erythrorhizon]|uniref:Endonuclease/exonuclease/phosphatase domain-containing protein n=1 Tax=Lithospermum erythrorhizon TaxID=34254 RepID=A0AAV3QZJ7_LITER